MEKYSMSTKETKVRVAFRPVPYIQEIHQAQDREPGYMYKNVIITYKNDPNRAQRYLQNGWEIVETVDSNKDDRSFTPNAKKEKIRPQMLVETTTDGHEQILMRILESKWSGSQVDKKQSREQLRLQDAKRRGDKIMKRGNEIVTTGAEVNEQTIFE